MAKFGRLGFSDEAAAELCISASEKSGNLVTLALLRHTDWRSQINPQLGVKQTCSGHARNFGV